MSTESTQTEPLPNSESRRTAERPGAAEQTGTSGVSDARRAQLERMEAEAGAQHEAADESVPQRSESDTGNPGLAPGISVPVAPQNRP